jgi:hypothetical protein
MKWRQMGLNEVAILRGKRQKKMIGGVGQGQTALSYGQSQGAQSRLSVTNQGDGSVIQV